MYARLTIAVNSAVASRLHSEADVFESYEKHRSTVRDACEFAESLNVVNPLLCHTEEKSIANRKKLYAEEGVRHYRGRLWIPDELEPIEL